MLNKRAKLVEVKAEVSESVATRCARFSGGLFGRSKLERYYFGFDIGGTNIKSGVISTDNRILKQKLTATNLDVPLEQNIAELLAEFEREGYPASAALGIGIGVPGWVDDESGTVKFSGNLKLKDYPLKERLEELTPCANIRILNDATTATLAERNLGAGKDCKNFLMLTVGTGIGGGICLNGEVIKNSCELGHIKVTDTDAPCTCGENGCFEAVASTKALVKMTIAAMLEHRSSAMWQKYDATTACGKTVFEFGEDGAAKAVLEHFIENLGSGIASLVNVLQPEVVILGGAIAKQGEKLTQPLERFVNAHTFGGKAGRFVKIVPSELEEAGLLGSRQLFE